MKKKKIIIAGGSGFVGKCISEYYQDSPYQLYILSRKHLEDSPNVSYLKWDGKNLGPWKNILEGAEVLINLSGKSVDCRYTEKNKQLIYDSRLDATRVLAKAVQQCQEAPKLWINAASATIYRHAEDRPMDEENGELGSGFSVDVCRKWESAFYESSTPDTRKVALRMAIVLGKEGGALRPLKNLVKLGLGGKQGSGRQYFSWLHEQDLLRIIDRIIQDPEMKGTYNASAPNPLPNKQFMKLLRKAQHVPFGLPTPKMMLSMGAFIIRTETELILKSRWVVPKRLEESGFCFQYPTFEKAIMAL